MNNFLVKNLNREIKNIAKIVIVLLLLFLSNKGNAQLNDLARIDFTYIPNSDSDDVEYSRFKALGNYPFKLKKEGAYLLVGLSYSNIHLRFQDDNLPFDKDLLNDFQLLDVPIGYTQKLKNDWRLGIRFTPGISTNLTANALTFKDVVFSGDVVFIKEKELDGNRKTRLILGASYSQNRGFLFPLPFISYYRKFHPNWSYNLGVPKTNLQYHFSEKNRLKLYAELDGFTSNLQNGVSIDGNGIAERINMSLILGGFQYEYHVTNHLQLYARLAYNFSIRNTLRDGNNTILTVDNNSRGYFRTGIRLKI